MIKKIVHLADLHIRTIVYHDMYKKQFNKFLKQITEQLTTEDGIIKEQNRIVIAGDIAHQKINISNEQMLLTSWFFQELTKLGKVIIIPGNHDFLENNVQRVDSITPIVELINSDDIVYYKDYGVYSDDNVNWVVYSLYQHNQPPIFTKDSTKTHIGLFHGAIQGFSTDLGMVFEDGYDKINFRDCDIVLCGDIHRRQISNLERVIEIDENELNDYIKNGWVKYE